MPESTPSADQGAQRCRRIVIRVAVCAALLFAFIIIAGIFDPVVGGPTSDAPKTRSLVELASLAASVTMYQQQYKNWPTQSNNSPGADLVISLKANAPAFIRIMSGKPSSNEVDFNKMKIAFCNFQKSELDSSGTKIVDAYGNDDIVIIMETIGDGIIAPFTRTLTAANGKTVTIRQTVPIHASVIAMSPGAGNSESDAITTWTVK